MAILRRLTNTIREITNIDAHIDTDSAERSIRNNIVFKGPNAWILAVAIIIASVGLNVNSIPVIIGAMLISPLMGPIFGLGLGLGINDISLMKQSIKNLMVMVSISLCVSFLYFMITPLELTNQSEILARTRPTIFDVMIALFGGFAGIFEQCRKEKGTVFSGVAIATALMPPLCTAGYGLAAGHLSYTLGALYLFLINCLFITLATYILVRYFRFKKTEHADQKSAVRTQRITSILILIFLIPSIWSAVILVQQNNFEKKVSQFIESYNSDNTYIYNYEVLHNEESILKLYLSGDPLTESTRNNLLALAKENGIGENQLIINEHTKTNDNELFKGINEKHNSEVIKYEARISQLTRELQLIKQEELPYVQIANELSASHPEIKHVYMARGAHITTDSLKMTECLIVKVKTDISMSPATIEQLRKWVEVRLQVENVHIIIDGLAVRRRQKPNQNIADS